MSGFIVEEEELKKAIFDTMSARSRKRIIDKGYEQWDPFLEPKDPMDLRMNQHSETALSLMRRFLQICPPEGQSEAYRQGVWEICLGIVGGDDRSKGISDFSRWYNDLSKNGEL